MKRWLFLLTALLIFTGCAAETEYPTPTKDPQSETGSITEPTDSYDPDSMLEVSTSGSMQVYPLSRSDCSRVAFLKDDLLLFSGTEETALTLLTGDGLQIGAELTLDCAIDAYSPAVQISSEGITYYDEIHRKLVFLDAALRETRRVPVPEAIIGSPALTADRKTLYYCSADTLRAIDLESGIDKLLKEMSHHPLSIIGLHQNETVLQCTVKDDNGDVYTLFLSTLTGETLHQVPGEVSLSAFEDTCFTIRQDGAYTELIVSAGDENVQLLGYEEELTAVGAVPELKGAVLMHTYEDEHISQLNFFDLTDGTLAASVNIPGVNPIRGILGDAGHQALWFLRYDSGYGCDILCRWDMSQNIVEEDSSRLTERHTAENPDPEGLERCAQTAAALSEQFGVEILIWKDAAICSTSEAPLTPEYQVPLIEQSLKHLEKALACYPEGFLTQAASATDSGVLKICLVRSIGSGEDALQYWTDDSACIALCPGKDLERRFHHQLFFVVENRVLGNCNAYDNWNSLNPRDFSYTLDYETAADNQWLEGAERAFLDTRSMSFPREDRAAVMEYAITPGNRDCFTSETMQSKLRKLCTGIRKAFDLEDAPEAFLWEQYLNE